MNDELDNQAIQFEILINRMRPDLLPQFKSRVDLRFVQEQTIMQDDSIKSLMKVITEVSHKVDNLQQK